jgi:hypothetical protein
MSVVDLIGITSTVDASISNSVVATPTSESLRIGNANSLSESFEEAPGVKFGLVGSHIFELFPAKHLGGKCRAHSTGENERRYITPVRRPRIAVPDSSEQ